MQYPKQVREDAQEMGFKAANKKFLADIMDDVNLELAARGVKVKFAVPSQFTFRHSVVRRHLDQYAPNWLEPWQKFRAALAAQENKRTLAQPALEALKECQQIIKKCFEEHPLESAELSQFLDRNARYMVRSTGKEDATDRANPGGNESIASVKPTPQAISDAAMEVLLSTFDFKSIAQRLKYTKKNEELQEFQEDPFLPVLVDTMIGASAESKVVSGVIYSSEGCTRIQVAPGFGELIVNSLGNFDNFYVTQDGGVYSEIMSKEFRLAPVEDQEKVGVKRVRNSPFLKAKPSLDPDVVRALHEFSKIIEEKYGMRIDDEFVYDLETQVVQVVQARAIPLGDRRNMTPSSISPQSIREVKASPSTTRGKVITPEVLRAQVITSSKEVIVRTTIGEALDDYLRAEEAGVPIKAVIVQQDAPDTSHEAGEFSSKAIPVLQVDNLRQIEQQLEQLGTNQALIVAPQHKLSTVVAVVEGGNAEQFCYQQGLLKEGVFRSAISPHVTPHFSDFGVAPERVGRVQGESLGVVSPGGFGAMVSAAKEGNGEQLSRLMSYLYNSLVEPGQQVAKKFKTEDLRHRLDIIFDINFGQSNVTQESALAEVVAFLVLLQGGLTKNEKPLDKALYQSLMLTAGELLVLMQRAEKLEYNPKTHLEYLDLIEKFNGLVFSMGKKGVLSDSLMLELREIVAEKKALAETPEATSLTKASQDYFLQMRIIGRRILKVENRVAWRDFCRVLYGTHAQSGEVLHDRKMVHGGAVFASLIANLVDKGILDVWLNTSFLDAVKEFGGDARKIYSHCLAEYDKAFKDNNTLEEASRDIEELERQIALWKDPKYFEQGYEKYKSTVEKLQKLLQFSPEDPNLKKILVARLQNRLIDAMDRTTKALEKSTDYTDKREKVANFRKMLEVSNGLMTDLIHQTGMQYPHLRSIVLKLNNLRFKDLVVPLVDALESHPIEDCNDVFNELNEALQVSINDPCDLRVVEAVNARVLHYLISKFKETRQAIDQGVEGKERQNMIERADRIYAHFNKFFKRFLDVRVFDLIENNIEDKNKKFFGENPLILLGAFSEKTLALKNWIDQNEFMPEKGLESQKKFLEFLEKWGGFFLEMEDLFRYSDNPLLNYIRQESPGKTTDHWWVRPFEKELSPSGVFEMLQCKLGAEGIAGMNNPTLEDLLALLHQNSVTALSLLSRDCAIPSERYPEDLQEKLQNLTHIPAIGVFGFFPSLDLVSTELDYPFIILHYNMSLRSHSAHVEVKYNIESQETIASVSAYGGGGNENFRWNNIEMRMNYFLRASAFTILRTPQFNESKNSVSFSVSMPTASSATHLSKHIADLARSTFMTSPENGQFFLEKNVEKEDVSILKEVFRVLKSLIEQHNEPRYKEYLEERIQWLEMQIDLKQMQLDRDAAKPIALEVIQGKFSKNPEITEVLEQKLEDLGFLPKRGDEDALGL